MPPTSEAMLSVGQVAVRCGVSSDAVRRAIRRGDLPASRAFNRVLIRVEDLEEYIERGRVGGGSVRRRRYATRSVQAGRGSLQAIERRVA